MRITGIMARRLLVNWRIPVAIARRALPAGVRPKIVAGHAVAGLCLVRLEKIRPVGMPAFTGLASENLAVRIGVEWDGGNGVLIFHRETASRLNAIVGTWSHYGQHHRSLFRVRDDGHSTELNIGSVQDGHIHHASVVDAPPTAPSVFEDILAAERFFRGGECGYSPGRRPGVWEGLRLRLHRWDIRAYRVQAASSSMIEALFDGHAILDSAFMMRSIGHTWTPTAALHWGEIPVLHRIQIAA
jgi:hypothetical protein